MEDRLKNTFVSQMKTFFFSLQELQSTYPPNFTAIKEKERTFNEFKKFVDKYCEDDFIITLFANPPKPLPDNVENKNVIGSLLAFFFGGLFSFSNNKLKKEAVIYIESLLEITKKAIGYYQNKDFFDKADQDTIS